MYIYVYNVYRYGRLKMVVYLINVLRPSRPELFVCLGHRQRALWRKLIFQPLGCSFQRQTILFWRNGPSICQKSLSATPTTRPHQGHQGIERWPKLAAARKGPQQVEREVFTKEQQKDNAFLGSIWVWRGLFQKSLMTHNQPGTFPNASEKR